MSGIHILQAPELHEEQGEIDMKQPSILFQRRKTWIWRKVRFVSHAYEVGSDNMGHQSYASGREHLSLEFL